MVSTARSARMSCVVCRTAYAGAERFCPLDGGAIVAADVGGIEAIQVGRTIDGRYLVRRLIGQGGMGAVYEAEHLGLDRRVAIKFLLGETIDSDMIARFRREARAASRVSHDHVVQIYDVGTDDDGRDFIVMEYLEGRDLRAVIADGELSVARAIAITRQLLDGLHAIHGQGILHRDVKPANVLLTSRDGETDVVKLTDFGIAKTAEVGAPNLTETGKIIGTPQYMAPEQLMGAACDQRADLYAVGLTLYEMLAGRAPFVSTASAELVAMQLTRDPPSLALARPDLPAGLIAIVERALAKDPADRFVDAVAFAEALAGDLAIGPQRRDPNREAMTSRERPHRSPAITPNGGSTRRRRWPWILGALVSLGVGTVLALVFRAGGAAPAARPPEPGLGVGSPVPPTAASPSALEQHLAYARAAERDAHLELAVAAYEEAAKLDPSADLRFRIANLHERLGHRADTARSLRAYLAAAPEASDREVVRARIAALETVAVDAGVPNVPDAPVGKRPGDGAKAVQKTCTCLHKDARVSSGWLCGRRGALHCRCIADDNSNLCPEFVPCSGSACDRRYDGYNCSIAYTAYGAVGVAGATCQGFGYPTASRSAGHLECLMSCAGGALTFVGEPDAACVGYDTDTGARTDGILWGCEIKR